MAPKRKRTSTTASMPPSRTKRTTSTPKAGLPQTSGIQEPAKRRSSRITAASTQMIAPVANMGCAAGAALEAEHGDVTRGLRKGNLKSPLMRIPRNVRDLIYAHLLTAPSYAKDRNAQSGLTSETAFATGTLDGPSDQGDVFRNGILPGSAHGYPFVDEAMGLLCASKQLHAEASEYFYSKNTFIIMPEHKSVQCFWHCGNDTCRKDIPCLVHLRNIKQIKHIAILVRNPYHFNDPSHDQGARCLQTNLNTIHRCLSEAMVKLDTLVVRYLSCVNGRVEDIRKKLDTILQDGGKAPTIMLKLSGKYRKGVRVEPGANRDYNVLFQNARVLDELKKMAGIAKSVAISGDISTSYIRELVDALVPDQPAPILSLKRKSGQLQAVEQPVKRHGTQVPQKRKSAVEGNGRMQAERGNDRTALET